MPPVAVRVTAGLAVGFTTGFEAAFVIATHGVVAAAFAVFVGADFFLNIDPRFEIAELAFEIALLAV